MENVIVDLAHALRKRVAIIRDEESRREPEKHLARLGVEVKKLLNLCGT